MPVKNITPEEYLQMRAEGTKHVLLDVRGQDEWDQGHVADAVFMPHWFVGMKAKDAAPDLSVPVVTYCMGGVRAGVAAAALDKLGYADVRAISGGGYPDLHALGL